jgi:hypothetical protein
VSEFTVRMSQREKQCFNDLLSKSKFYLEFGAGGSTIMAAQSSAQFIVSVESDSAWIAKLKEEGAIKTAELAGRLFLLHIDIGSVGSWGAPVDERRIKSWVDYYTQPFILYDFPFELILIDGRFRVACALATAVFAQPIARVAIHDYELRTKYYAIEKYFDIIDSVGTLYIMRKRSKINCRSLYLDIMSNLFDAI